MSSCASPTPAGGWLVLHVFGVLADERVGGLFSAFREPDSLTDPRNGQRFPATGIARLNIPSVNGHHFRAAGGGHHHVEHAVITPTNHLVASWPSKVTASSAISVRGNSAGAIHVTNVCTKLEIISRVQLVQESSSPRLRLHDVGRCCLAHEARMSRMP
jgi:hypothetical protein